MKHMWVPFGLRPRVPEEGPRYADLYERGVAAAIDVTLIFYLLESIVFRHITPDAFGIIDPERIATIEQAPRFSEMMNVMVESGFLAAWITSTLAQLTVIGVLMVGSQLLYSTTPGKWLLGLKICRADTLEPPAAWRYILRYLAYIPACAPFMIGMFWMLFNKRRRGWHDYIAGTVVINTRPHGWYWQQTKRGVRWLINRFKKPQ
jgi:uncharacterized RDD family membrane protein YckC